MPLNVRSSSVGDAVAAIEDFGNALESVVSGLADTVGQIDVADKHFRFLAEGVDTLHALRAKIDKLTSDHAALNNEIHSSVGRQFNEIRERLDALEARPVPRGLFGRSSK